MKTANVLDLLEAAYRHGGQEGIKYILKRLKPRKTDKRKKVKK